MRILALLLVASNASCAANPPQGAIDAGSDDAADARDFDDCLLTAFGADLGGQCIAQWICREEGILSLACGEVDGGVACVCAREEYDPVVIDLVPASCDDALVVTAFARDNCGWSWL